MGGKRKTFACQDSRTLGTASDHPHLEWPQLGQVMQPSTMRIPY